MAPSRIHLYMEECTLLILIGTFHPEHFVYLFIIRSLYMNMCVSTQFHQENSHFYENGVNRNKNK